MIDYKLNEIDAARFWDSIDQRISQYAVANDEYTSLILFSIAITFLPPKSAVIVEISSKSGMAPLNAGGRNLIESIRLGTPSISNEIRSLYKNACKFFNIDHRSISINPNDLDNFFHGVLFEIIGMDKKSLKDAYEFGFLRLQKRKNRITFESERYSAGLAATIMPPNTSCIIDAFGQAGEFPLQAFKNSGKITAIWFPFLELVSLELLLRLAVNGIDPESIIVGEEIKTPSIDFDMALSDASHYLNAKNRNFKYEEQIDQLSQLSPIFFSENSKLSVIVATKNDANGAGIKRAFRKQIVSAENLLAIMNIPSGVSKPPSIASIWITQNNKLNHLGNLAPIAINTDSIEHLLSSDAEAEFYGFVACLLSLAHPKSINNNFGMSQISKNDMFDSLFVRAFNGAYKDISGFCRRISREEIEAKDYSLWKGKYIEIRPAAPWLSGLDYEDILTAISNKNSSESLNVYVIGDNGQGKSLLLKDLIVNHASQFRKILAISNGMHDRFPAIRDKKFQYLGAKIIGNPLSAKKQSIAAANYALAAYTNYTRSYRWDFLQNALKSLGFSQELHLIHSAAQAEDESNDSTLASIITLPPHSDFDKQNINRILEKKISANDFHLGVRRLLKGNTIVKFSDLSSGEQNSILLLLKIAANIETNSLILIDEPEISLHVSWQRLLPKILEEISSHFASVIVVATHSPIIISEATGQADRCFLAEQRVTTIIQEQDRRSIEALLFESFKTHTINNREVHEKCAKLLRQSIEIANQEIFNDHQIESNIATLRAMQKIVLNNGNDMSGNLQSFKNDFVFIESAIDAIRKIKDLRGAGS